MSQSATPEVNPPELSVNAGRLLADMEALAGIGRGPGGGLDRSSFSAFDLEARAWYLAACEGAGLVAETDGIGNFIVSSPVVDGANAGAPAVWSGSHIDTVPNGGAFDGALGSLAALECLRTLHEAGTALARPVRVVMYTDEEGNYAHLLGSSALVKGFTVEELNGMRGRDGDLLADTFAAAGGSIEAASRAKLPAGAVHASVELHIEQGPNLENEGLQVGIVTGIVGLGGGVVTFLGRADHAGTTPMTLRRDAGAAAGEFMAALPGIPQALDDVAVATSGILKIEPGGSNIVPSAAHVTVDFRHPTLEGVHTLQAAVQSAAREIAGRHGLEVEFDFEPIVPPAPMDEGVRREIQAAVDARGLSSRPIPSGAGHDSQNMATIAPTGMIFVPSAAGRSHCPEEYTADDDVVRGANVLLDTIVRLAS